MKISYKVTGAKRKELVTAIGNELNQKPNYCGAPTFAFEIGDLHIDKDGTVTGPDDRGLIADLDGIYGMEAAEAVFDQEKPQQDEAQQEAPQQEAPQQEAPQQEDEQYDLTITLPRSCLTDDSLERLKRIINSKGSLIMKALGLTSLPIDEDEETISFPWFATKEANGDVIRAYTLFVSKMAAMARSLKRVNRTDELPVENEKYAFRCFLLRIGLIGNEFKQERHILMRNFTGSGAFKSGVRHQATEAATNEAEPVEQNTDIDEAEATSSEEQEAAENE